MSNEETAVGELKQLVKEFNEHFKDWSNRNGMVVKFGWNYGAENFPKELKILGVDKIIWREEPPKWKQTLSGAFEEAKKISKEAEDEGNHGETEKTGDQGNDPGRGDPKAQEEQRGSSGIYTKTGEQRASRGRSEQTEETSPSN